MKDVKTTPIYTDETEEETVLFGTLETAWRQRAETKRLEKLYGGANAPKADMIEEGIFHYLPHAVQVCCPLCAG